MNALERNGERILKLCHKNFIRRCHGRPKSCIGLGNPDAYLKDLRIRIRSLFSDVGHSRYCSCQRLIRIRIELELHLLPDRNLLKIDFIDVRDRFHLAQIREGRNCRIPRTDRAADNFLFSVPLTGIDHHAIGRRFDRELHHRLHVNIQPLLFLHQVNFGSLSFCG